MNEPSLEILTAYVDGELDDSLRREVDEAIHIDATLRATVDQLQASRIMVRDAFAGVLDAPVPARLTQALESVDTHDKVIRLPTPERMNNSWMSLAMAASVSLTVGALVGFLLADNRPQAMPETTADLVQRVLETMPTGSTLISSDERSEVTSLSSFRIQDGRICREFEQRTAAQQGTGIACRNPLTADWQTQILVTSSRALSDVRAGESYTPAAGAADPLDWVFDHLGAAPALNAAEEAELIARQWQD